MKAAPLIHAEDVVKTFKTGGGTLTAVNHVSLDLFPGETLALVGESGCGKTTLGQLLVALEKPTAGEILFEGHSLNSISKRELHDLRKEMQIVFQDPYSSLDPRMTIYEIVAEPLKAYHVFSDKEKLYRYIEDLLEKVGVPRGYADRYPHQFSGGQRQRICIARALALRPKLIVCDEPVSALDVSVQAQILNLLHDLREEFGLTYLFISHDLAVVRYISNSICVMFLGSICEHGNTEEIFNAPMHPYTRYLLSSTPSLDPSHRRDSRDMLNGEMPSPINPPSGCPFRTRCGFATEICAKEKPALKTVGSRQIACHHPLHF